MHEVYDSNYCPIESNLEYNKETVTKTKLINVSTVGRQCSKRNNQHNETKLFKSSDKM